MKSLQETEVKLIKAIIKLDVSLLNSTDREFYNRLVDKLINGSKLSKKITVCYNGTRAETKDCKQKLKYDYKL